ncbi:uncharacterized protein TRIVIDRAFT_225835 [Trichoderma virens Gv29-8]|uniref:BTB domain-containing protein n=1 Tax=Hypocrea virens (strain Gv29-8 / FGSC 10586) TaxID=413071 RepID=G9N4K6_HYPVG|nr:uncharacterized protein TRIVIDRAFT_225835 [Trichoderma virens Gv29-8]EHK18531.1 hypothetical protein TRIVIDRAFT_225835 [Trichoderma virens Gv29-8]UKZ52738.1 hypothetical protein TrVGV298_006525 [Trichoderma virens]
MAAHRIDIDPDGDTLIILPTVQVTAEKSSDAARREMNGTDAPESTAIIEEIFYFKVSMKHLTMASPRAKMEFEPIFDPYTFEIVLAMIHAKTEKLPTDISIAMLSNIAVVADDLNCSSAVQSFATQWIDRMTLLEPHTIDIRLAQLLLISSVFKSDNLFIKATYKAVLLSPDEMPSFGLPIWPAVLRER